MDCENCRHLTVVGLHDTGPRHHARQRREELYISRIISQYSVKVDVIAVAVDVAGIAVGGVCDRSSVSIT